VSFEIEPLGELVKLTVVHDGFEADSLWASLISQGWPPILSNLKTLLETGETLPADQEPPPHVRLGLTTPREQQAAAE
jgi:Activator of Hsp90 ATPase homolog 1-like protein